MGRGGRRGGSGGGSSGSGGSSSGNHFVGGRLRLRNSTGGGGTYQEDCSIDLAIDGYKRNMSEDKMCKLFLDDFYECFSQFGDHCVNISHTIFIRRCPAKYQEAFIEHLKLDSPVKGCPKDSYTGCDTDGVHAESLEERCSRYLKNYERIVRVHGMDDGQVCLFGKIFAKCPDKFREVLNRT